MAGKKKLGGVDETNRRLGRIEDTLTTASKVFERMHERLEQVEGQQALVEGQQRVIERLERLESAVFAPGAPR